MSKNTTSHAIFVIFVLFIAVYGIYQLSQYLTKKSKYGLEGNTSTIDPTYSNISGPQSLSNTQGLASATSNKPVQNPSELLPKGQSQWSNLNPSGKGELENINMLSAGYLGGINTVGSSLRNANLQVRSEPPNPRNNVGPWNNTTITGNPYQVPLELGQGGL